MTAPLPDFAIDAVISPALSDVLRERARAIITYGHDAAADDALPLHALGEKAAAFLHIASDRAAVHGQSSGDAR